MEQGPGDQLTQQVSLLALQYVCFKKQTKNTLSQHLKMWLFHVKILTWASLEKDTDLTSKTPPLPTQSKLVWSYFIFLVAQLFYLIVAQSSK